IFKICTTSVTPRRCTRWSRLSAESSVCPSGTLSTTRFYSCGEKDNEDLKDSNSLTTENSLSTGELNKTSSEQRQRTSPFLELLHRCNSPSDVLDLASKYTPTNRQVSQCLSRIWFSTKKLSDEQRRYELQLMFEHPEFENLLQKATRSIQYMRNEDVAYSLLSVVNLGLAQRSRVIQTFLRTCQERLNDFDEKALSILASALERMKASQNVDALKEGMRLVVEARLPEIQNVLALQTMMRLLGRDAPRELKQKLERKALSMTDQFSLPNAQHMIFTMATIGFHSKPLLKFCSDKIKDNLHDIPFNILYNILQSYKELLYRDIDLLTSISDHVASTFDIWTNKQLVFFLSAFKDRLFCPTSLMEPFTEKVIANPDALTLKDLLSVLAVYSSLNYDLRFLDSLSHALISYLPKMSGLELLKAAYYLCGMNHFPSALLEQLLTSSTLEQLLGCISFVLDICLRLDRPLLPQPLTVPLSVLGNPTPNPLVNPRLSKSLVTGSFNWSNIGTNICVITLYYFCFGTSHPRGPLALQIRHLKILGYTPVLATEQLLQSSSEEEMTDKMRGLVFPEHASDAQPQVGDVES
uniref:FAST kinase domains 2 n=1 Tax=Xiphophorus couchianus TaxID=32473 RepID=A0A3B5MUG0_9TELE